MSLLTFASRPAEMRAELLGNPPGGHAHFWERALSRRRVLAGGAGVLGAALTVDLVRPLWALAGPPGSGLPAPIPGGVDIAGTVFHLYLPGPADNPSPSLESPGGDPSSIFDFNGAVGVGVAKGSGIGTNPDGTTAELFYEVDQRFMKGAYVDRTGRHRNAVFGFV